ncbi:hypothetical protein CTA1_2692 [Colletotrichum tanaceti]|uniref:Uncharacterized protein n=1 Tax=Colletotrichum tanaceti TaxID=1306861 RepID=A0A4U6WZB7_9PEZI|nr:hypothetical protein CTA1_2692 [Colletotrichum tanaceti]
MVREFARLAAGHVVVLQDLGAGRRRGRVGSRTGGMITGVPDWRREEEEEEEHGTLTKTRNSRSTAAGLANARVLFKRAV